MRLLPSLFLLALFLLSWTGAYCQNHQAAVGDLNGDGKPDVVVANPSLNNVGVFLNTGGALGPGTFLAVSGRPDSVSLADINGDGKLDILLVVASTNGTGTTSLQAMLGNGSGGFAAAVTIPTGSAGPITNLIVADFNGDGFPDIAFGTGTSSLQISIIFGDGHGGFSAPRAIAVAGDGTSAVELVLLDANKDSKPDLAVNTASVAANLHESFLLLNDGTGNFSISHLSSFNGATNLPSGFVTAVADFNSDGNPDLLFGPNSSSFILFGDGHGGALFATPIVSFIGAPQGFAADVDGDHTIDLASPTLGSYFPGNGHGGFGDPISLGLPQGSTLIAVADMNSDGKPDFIVQSGTNVSVVLNSLTAPANASASTVLQLSASADTTSVGLPVTLAASVASYGGTPSAGNVTFFDGVQILGSAPVNAYGVAALNTTFSSAGVHNNLTATFSGGFDALNNTFFLLSNNASDPRSISVNTSQPTASAPTITLTAFPNPARVLNPVTLSATVASSSGTPTGKVVFTADGNVVGIFGLPKVALVVTFPGVGLHNLQATYGGDATFPQASSATLVEDIRTSVPADFSIAASPQSATIRAGQTATFNITINPSGDITSTVGFSCSGLPAASICSFSPATLMPGVNPVSTVLTVTTTAPSSAVPLNRQQPGPLFWLFAFVAGFALLVSTGLRRMRTRKLALVFATIAFVLLLGSCGGGSSSVPVTQHGTPPGTSSITVTATSATSHTSALTITVTP